MEGPGMSLFQGAASIHINNSAQDRLEEQEELEDQKRRNEELHHELENAFHDLQDDDDASSVNSSGNFTLDAGQNGAQHHIRTGLPPTYVESLNHLKEQDNSKLYCETPKSNQHLRHQEEHLKLPFSPYGAGDGQNHYLLQELRGGVTHLNGVNNFDARQEYTNSEQLKVMYEMRVKECQQLAAQMQQVETEVDSLRARLLAAINDRDKSELSLKEAHQLLASNKHKSIELQQQVTALEAKLMETDQDKEQLKLELRSANITLQDVQQRLHTLQVAHTHDTDALFRDQQNRHREEVDRLQNDLVKYKTRLEDREKDIKVLERRCMDREREKEEIIVEKGALVNRLVNELEAAQRKLVSGEAAKLKEKVAQLTAERNTAREQVKELGSKLEVTVHELVLCRNKVNAVQKEHDNWRTTLHQMLAEVMPDNNTYMGEPPSPGKLTALKDVLNRYKMQSQKMSSLHEEISKRDKKLEQHRKQESELRSKLEEQKGVELQLTSKLAVLQNKLELLGSNSDSELLENYKQQNERLQAELEEVRSQHKQLDLKYTELEMECDKLRSAKGSRASLVQEANADLLRELERYSAQLKDTLRENGELKNLYLQVCSSRDTITRELKDLQMRIQKDKEIFKTQEKDYVERIEKEKQQIEKLAAELSSSRGELEIANKRISELQNEFKDKQKEFSNKLNKYLEDEKHSLRKDMEPCSQCEKNVKRIRQLDEQLSKCSVRLATQESNDELMKELKGKAEFFQQYIVERFRKLGEQRSVGTNTDADQHLGNSIEKLVHDCDHATHVKTDMMMKEKAIRDQIAEKFTLEMKTVEMNCARRIKELENEHLGAISKLRDLLERKAQEVETLKTFILSERAKITQILEAKENEISVLIKEHNELQAECQKANDGVVEWRLKAERYKERISRYGSLEDVLKHERERSSSCAKECQAVKTKLTELQAKNTQLEHKCEKLQAENATLQEKYKNVKKTVFTYKDYMTKKDAHVSNEMNRIQDEYRKIFIKLQNQVNYHVNCRIQEERNNGKPAQAQQYQHSDYSEKLKKLNEDFARLAQSRFKETPEN